jgi:hypothetical protein
VVVAVERLLLVQQVLVHSLVRVAMEQRPA